MPFISRPSTSPWPDPSEWLLDACHLLCQTHRIYINAKQTGLTCRIRFGMLKIKIKILMNSPGSLCSNTAIAYVASHSTMLSSFDYRPCLSHYFVHHGWIGWRIYYIIYHISPVPGVSRTCQNHWSCAQRRSSTERSEAAGQQWRQSKFWP